MNTFDLACAVLSSSAYRELFNEENRIQPLTDAIRLPGSLGYKTIGGISGFEASAFEYEGKIVIAYAGTNPTQLADLAADGAMALQKRQKRGQAQLKKKRKRSGRWAA